MRTLSILSSCLLIFLCACGPTILSKAPETPFLEEVDQKQKSELLPFDHSWVEDNLDLNSYSKIVIKPVRLDFLPEDTWPSNKGSAFHAKKPFDEAVQKLAVYFENQIRKRIESTKKNHFKVVEANSQMNNTLVLEAAFTQLQFSRPLRYAGSVAIPLPGASQVVGAVQPPALSMAVRITDGKTGALVMSFSDRETPPARIVDFNRFTATSPLREICSDWAKLIGKVLNKKDGERIRGNQAVSLLPW